MVNDFDAVFRSDEEETLQLEYQELEEGVILFELNGVLDNYNTNFLRKKIELAQKYDYNCFVLDCENLGYISSSGVGMLSSFLSPLRKLNGGIILLGIATDIRQVFDMVGLGHFVMFGDTLAEAKEYFSQRRSRS